MTIKKNLLYSLPLFVSPVFAFESNLEDIFNIEVQVASKQLQKTSEAPASVTVHSKKQIEALGYDTLYDLANITSGYSGYKPFGERVFETRGQKAGSWNNNKHYLLLDGIPFMHGRGNKVFAGYNMPIFGAKQVEFLKGPSSALYGTGAFYGVINIVTDELKEKGSSTKYHLKGGNQDQDRLIQANFQRKTESNSSHLNVSYFTKKDSLEFVGDGLPENNSDNNLYFDRENTTFIHWGQKFSSGIFKGLKLGFIYTDKESGLGESWNGIGNDKRTFLRWRTITPYIKHKKKFSEDLNISSYFKYSKDTEASNLRTQDSSNNDQMSQYNAIINNYEAQSEISYNYGKDSHLIAGVNATLVEQNNSTNDFASVVSGTTGELVWTDSFQLQKGHNFLSYSAFIQSTNKFDILSGLNLTTGVRYDAGKAITDKYNQLSPRLSLVQKFNKNFFGKALYNTALRSPGIKELPLNEETKPNLSNSSVIKELKPETIQSIEFGLGYQNDNLSLVLSIFQNETKDTLDAEQVEVGQNAFVNKDGKTIAKGYEIDLLAQVTKRTRLFSNYSYAYAKNEVPDANTYQGDVPTYKANLGIVDEGSFISKLTSSFVIRHIGEYRTTSLANRPEGHTLLDTTFTYKLNTESKLQFLIRNLADKDYRLPSNNVKNIPMPDRSFHLAYRSEF